MRAILTLPAALAIAACATGERADYAMSEEDRAMLDRELAGYEAGEPENCLDLKFVNNSRVIDDRTVIYRRGGTKYLTTFDNRCPALERTSETLVFRTFSGRVCDVDIIQTIDNQTGLAGPACSIDTITPYNRVD